MAARALAAGWEGVQRSEVWPADMQALYAALPRSGYGSLAVAEAALAAGKPAARVVKTRGPQRLALAAPELVALLDGASPRKVIVRPPKIVNVVL